MKKRRMLEPLRALPKSKTIYAFDIETHPVTGEFVMGSIIGPGIDQEFYNKQAMADFVATRHELNRKSSYLCATMAAFDTMALFSGTAHQKNLYPLFRGSHMVCAYLYPYGINDPKKHKITIIDSLSFLPVSVEELGKIMGLPKLAHPDYITEKRAPTMAEFAYITRYNRRDTLITLKFMEWLQDVLNGLGAKMRMTVASTALDLFKRKYLKEVLFQEPEHIHEFLFKGYYGGRTEALHRGRISGPLYYYDVNSMYSYVMQNDYPHVNHSNMTEKGNMSLIEVYEGVSDVDIEAPLMQLPYLPFRAPDGKLMFPTGTFSGHYTHFELRKALSLGYKIHAIRKCVYYTRTHKPFIGYVTDLYAKRMTLKGDTRELVVKLMLTSLYGKMGERPRDGKECVHIDSVNIDEIRAMAETGTAQIVGDYIYKQGVPYTPSHTNPIYAIYTTAYARTVLWNLAHDKDPVYMDTDSIITRHCLDTGMALGQLKLEHTISEAIIVRPKMYAFLTMKGTEHCKVKGLPPSRKWDYYDFEQFLAKPEADYSKLAKFRETIRKGLPFNVNIDVHKEICLEDNKRAWPSDFTLSEQESSPIHATDGLLPEYTRILEIKAELSRKREKKAELKRFHQSDKYDRHAVGKDISYDEFDEIEKFFAINTAS